MGVAVAEAAAAAAASCADAAINVGWMGGARWAAAPVLPEELPATWVTTLGGATLIGVDADDEDEECEEWDEWWWWWWRREDLDDSDDPDCRDRDDEVEDADRSEVEFGAECWLTQGWAKTSSVDNLEQK